MIETTFPLNKNTFKVEKDRLRIQVGGFFVYLREDDIKDLVSFLALPLVREYNTTKLLINLITDGKHLHN